MVNLCICSMQVHQSRVNLPFLQSSHCHPQWLFPQACYLGYTQCPLDPILCLIVVHGFLSLGKEGVHAFVCAKESVHAYNGFERQDAAKTTDQYD